MNILNRYIGTTVIGATALVMLILIGLQAFIEFINELHSVGSGNYGVLQAFVYVPLLLPHDLYGLFPVAGLIGCLIGLGRLASNSELIVMRASSLSKAQIGWAVIKATFVMLIFITAMGEFIAPMAKHYAVNYRAKIVTGAEISQIRRGVWVRDGENFIHVDQMPTPGHLQGITRYKFDQQRLERTSVAQTAYYQDGEWIFENVDESQMNPNSVTTQHFAKQKWNVSFDPKFVAAMAIESDETSLFTLYRYIDSLKASGLSANQYEFQLWKRIFQPLATIVMIGLAIPFIFGPLRTVTMGLRVLIGVVVGIGFYTLNEFIGPFSLVYQIPPLWSAAMPVILFAIVDGFLLWFVR